MPDDSLDVPLLKVYSLDIEVDPIGSHFPKPEDANDPITLISICDQHEKTVVTFGINPYNGKWKDSEFLTYTHCKNEQILLINFFNYMHQNPCDVLTGWYVESFDLLYLVNRAKNIFGENNNVFPKISPINRVRVWNTKDGYVNIDISGITILDYLDVYQWYGPSLPSYKLDFVCQHELGKGKLDYSEYENLSNLCTENWDLYVEYNIIDTWRVIELEEKNGYIKLIQTISLLCRAPMKNYRTMTVLIEGLLLTYYRRNNLCAPHFQGGTQEWFPAAIVKEPQKGMFEWVVDLDITSSYPTAIITLNMSPETYYGRILGMTESEVTTCTSKRDFPPFEIILDRGKVKITGPKLEVFNKALKKRLLAIAPCGSVFTTSRPGIMAQVERQVFKKRNSVRKKRSKLLASLPELRDETLKNTKEKIDRYFSVQLALKILLNSFFGITSVPYSRYFNINISEAITSCGRCTILSGEKFVNNLLNNPNDGILDVISKMKREIK